MTANRTLSQRIRAYSTAHPAAIVSIILVVAFLYYWPLLTHGNFNLFHKTWMGLAFNSMLLHLADGRFDVDPDAILFEGFVRDGKTYSYYGVFFALLRAPLLILSGLREVNFTLVSCLVADLIVVYCQARLVMKLFAIHAGPRADALFLPLLAVAVLAGPQVYMLRPSIYQEVSYWALALSYVFVFVLLDTLLLGRPATVGRFLILALLAGLALLARVSTGIGLYAATIVALAVLPRAPNVRTARLAIPMVVLAVFAGATLYVNFMRWGDPLVFMDPHRDISYEESSNPGAIARIDTYGTFNFVRLGYGLLYYFVPLWMAHGDDGNLLFHAFRTRTIDMVELPPASFFITDPLPIVFALWMLVRLIGRWTATAMPLTLSLLAFCLAIPGGGMLLYMAYAVRYRVDFYPAILFLGLLGVHAYLAEKPKPVERPGAWAWPLAGVGILVAPVLLLLYYASPFGGRVDDFAREGWIAGYRQHIFAGMSQGGR